MPWRAKYITTRRHPLALACYAMSALIGAFFVFGLFQAQSTSEATTNGWQTAWEWELLLGGAIGLISACWPSVRHLDDALSGESMASVIAGFGFLSWAVSAGSASQWSSPAFIVFSVVAVGFGARSLQAQRDRRKWLALAEQIAQKDEQQ